jgi:hypothetical protein
VIFFFESYMDKRNPPARMEAPLGTTMRVLQRVKYVRHHRSGSSVCFSNFRNDLTMRDLTLAMSLLLGFH